MFVAADCPDELLDFDGLDDWFHMIETGMLDGRPDDVTRATEEAARALLGRGLTQ